MKCCGNCKFFGADSEPSYMRYEKEWTWAGRCLWNAYPIPRAAVKCWMTAHNGGNCPTWELGEVDWFARIPEPVHVPSRPVD